MTTRIRLKFDDLKFGDYFVDYENGGLVKCSMGLRQDYWQGELNNPQKMLEEFRKMMVGHISPMTQCMLIYSTDEPHKWGKGGMGR